HSDALDLVRILHYRVNVHYEMRFRNNAGLASFLIIIQAGLLLGQTPGAAGRGGGRGGAGVPRVSVKVENWGRMTLAAPGTIGWRIGIPSSSFRPLTFWDAAAKIDALNIDYIGGFSGQQLSLEIPKKLDY